MSNTPLEDQTCLDCRYYIGGVLYVGNSEFGECHRRPPRIAKRTMAGEPDNQGRWPAVTSSDWCGEFDERKDNAASS